MTSVLTRTHRGEAHGRRESHVKMDSEMRVIQPQAKECLETPEAERDKKGLSPGSLRDPSPMDTLISDF